MIYQITEVKTKTEPLPTINRDLLKTRHIQAHVREMAATGSLPKIGTLSSPYTAETHLVSVSRWIE